MKICFTTFCVMLISFLGYSQTLEINGTVVEEGSNLPLPGVSVIVKGTTNGTTTDFDGIFTLKEIQLGATISFVYLGFRTVDVVVQENKTLNVVMAEDLQALDEVVVVAFGTQAKKEITGAVSIVNAETLADIKPVRVEDAIRGRTAGVQVTTGSGTPGEGFTFNIRGISSSNNGSNQPLIVLDGNIFDGNLGDISPNDIESISILKDASAAIYGVRSANGVILITSKKGKRNTAPQFEFNAYTGFQEVQRTIPILNATEYALLINEARTNGGQSPLFTDVTDLGAGTNFQDLIFETAPISNTEFRVNGGGEKITYALSTGFLTQDGIVGGDRASFDRFTTRLNLNIDLTDKLAINTNLFYSNNKRRTVNSSGLGGIIFNALNVSPIDNVRDADGNFTLSEGTGNEVINPIAQLENSFGNTNTNGIGGVVGTKYTIDDNWSLETRLGFDYSIISDFNFSPIAFFGAGKVFNIARSSVTEIRNSFFDFNWDNLVNYRNVFNKKHDLQVTLGHQVIQNTGDFFNATGFDVPNNSIEFADLSLTTGGIEDQRFGNGQFRTRLASLFTRIQYNFDSKYLFSFSLRRDVSDAFGPENTASFFPAGSLGWIVTEDFFKESEVLNFLKLRASLGILGNDANASGGFRSTLDGEAAAVFDGNTIVNGRATGRIPNPEIKFEEQTQFDVGIDIGVFNNINITADYFVRDIEDLIVQSTVSGILGASAPGALPPFINAGGIQNKGFELSINYNNQISEDLSIGASFNFTNIDSEVTEVGNDAGFIPGGSFGVGQEPPSRFENGFTPGHFFGLETDGIFQNASEVASAPTQENAAPGEFRFVDQNGDGVIDGDDRTFLGSPVPDINFGFSFNIDYKGFDFNTYAFAQLGNEIVRNFERNQPLTNSRSAFLNRFTTEGSTNSFPRVTTGPTSTFQFSDFFVEDGSFLRLQTIELGYSIPAKHLDNLGIGKFRIYGQVNNVFTLTEYSGFDPTVASTDVIGGGIDSGSFPIPRTYLFGVNVKF